MTFSNTSRTIDLAGLGKKCGVTYYWRFEIEFRPLQMLSSSGGRGRECEVELMIN